MAEFITNMTEADYDPVFKINYLELGDNLYSSFDNVTSQVKKSFGTIGGKQSNYPIETTFGGGVGGSDNGTLPEPENTEFLEPILRAKRSYGRIKIDGLTIASSNKDEHAFVKAIDQETTGKLKSFNRWKCGQFFNDGTGALGQFDGSASGTQVDPVVTILATGRYRRRAAYFEKGDFVNVNTLPDVFKVISYNRSTGALTLKQIRGSSDLTAIGAGTHTIYMQNSKDADPYGLLGISNDSTFYGVSEQYRYQPHTLATDPNGAPLNTEMLTEMVENMDTETDMPPNLIVFSPLQYRKYLAILESQKRYPVPVEMKIRPNQMTSEKLIARVSFSGFQYAGAKGGIVCMKNRFVRDDMVWFLTLDTIEMMHVQKPGWRVGPDDRVFTKMEGLDAYEARYICYHQNKFNPWHVGYIENLQVPS